MGMLSPMALGALDTEPWSHQRTWAEPNQASIGGGSQGTASHAATDCGWGHMEPHQQQGSCMSILSHRFWLRADGCEEQGEV